MMKFEHQFNPGSSKIIVELPSESTLSEVLENFEHFLKASGYVFDGIGIIEYKDKEHE